MTMTFEEHLKVSHDFREALHTLYPEKVTQQPKKEEAKDTKK